MELKPIDWSKENSIKNYCGYCTNITCVCDGSCFKEEYIDFENNRKDHLKNEILRSKFRNQELNQELQKIENNEKV
jgi:hypothetical protein